MEKIYIAIIVAQFILLAILGLEVRRIYSINAKMFGLVDDLQKHIDTQLETIKAVYATLWKIYPKGCKEAEKESLKNQDKL